MEEMNPTISSPGDFVDFMQKNGEQIVQEAQEIAKKTAEIEVALLDFEIFYSVMVSEKTREKSSKWFEKNREKMWKTALKKAKGNEEKALAIYGDV